MKTAPKPVFPRLYSVAEPAGPGLDYAHRTERMANMTVLSPARPSAVHALALAVAAVGALGATPNIRAQGQGAVSELETVTVVGTRTERTLGEVEATISVYDKEDIERFLVRDIQDLVRYEPGVSVGGTGSRFGLDGFTIRGIGGNRVLTLIDGIRAPEEFSFGPFLSSRRDFVDVDTISRIEIARGPVSTLYGSDALGGVVAITTRAPNEYISADDSTYADFKAGYSSEDNSFIGTFNGAYGTEQLAGLLTYTYRTGEETETAGNSNVDGPTRTEADPQDVDTQTVNFKLGWSPAEGHNLIFAYEDFDSTVDTTLRSDFGIVSRGTLIQTRVAEDERERNRYSLNYRYNGEGFIDSANATLYRQESEAAQFTFEDRLAPPGLFQQRQRGSFFNTDITGLFAQASSNFSLGSSQHTLTYGVDVYQTDNENLRNGGTVDADGQTVVEFLPLPTRDFPPTEVENRALFIQDEIVLLDGRLRITPGLRFDDYEADVSQDPIFFAGNPGVAAPDDFEDSELTLKLGALYNLSNSVSVWGRYSEGFRAPPYDDVNNGFSNFIGGYKTISAPNLESETSQGFELGLRIEGEVGNLQLAVFDTLYDNFILEQQLAPQFLATGGIDPSDGLLTFQAVNLEEVEVKGVELRGLLALGALGSGLSDFYLEGALAYADGEEDDGTPLDNVDPLNAVLGLRWMPATLPVEGELVWTWSDEKNQNDISDPSRPASDSYNIIDLLVHYEFSDRLQLDAGVFNLFDEEYIRWADTLSIGGDAPERFTRPGRNFSITLRASL
ncbi:MAG: TonB-dependent hemoglobin/transferrin/lactoferrin family receptor [Pseudomonadota bacterium]